jgi:flagellar hook-length control protein FliK
MKAENALALHRAASLRNDAVPPSGGEDVFQTLLGQALGTPASSWLDPASAAHAWASLPAEEADGPAEDSAAGTEAAESVSLPALWAAFPLNQESTVAMAPMAVSQPLAATPAPCRLNTATAAHAVASVTAEEADVPVSEPGTSTEVAETGAPPATCAPFPPNPDEIIGTAPMAAAEEAAGSPSQGSGPSAASSRALQPGASSGEATTTLMGTASGSATGAGATSRHPASALTAETLARSTVADATASASPSTAMGQDAATKPDSPTMQSLPSSVTGAETLYHLIKVEAKAPAHADIAVAVTSPHFPDAAASRVTWLVAHGIEQAEITVNPPELGPVQVRISLESGEAHILLTAAVPETCAALETSLPRLAERLAENGIALANASVSRDGRPREERSPAAPARDSRASAAVSAISAPAASARSRVGLVDDFA